MPATKTPARPAKGHSKPQDAAPARPTLTEVEIEEARHAARDARVKACGAELRELLSKYRCRLTVAPDPDARPTEVAPGMWFSPPVPMISAEELEVPKPPHPGA
jgi:hypothetical protein